MKAALVLALGLVSSVSFANGHKAPAYGRTCHQGYEYKLARDTFGKSVFVLTGRRCN